MNSYGARSKAKLLTVRPDLREVAYMVMSWQVYDLTIIHGWRGEEVQNEAFLQGNSNKEWPDSKHNIVGPDGEPLSDALDFGPWCMLPTGRMGIPWKDTHAFAVIGGMFIAAGAVLGTTIIYGGDWDMDGTTTDQNLMDWGHVEVAS